jgi:hypothetical protein
MAGERYKNKYPFHAMNDPYQTRMRGELSDTDAMHAPRMYVSPTAPSVNNDERDAAGIQTVFQRSDLWWETTNKRMYICADPTNASADWELLNGIGGYPVDNTDLVQGSYPWFDTASASFKYTSRWEDLRFAAVVSKLGGVKDPTLYQFIDNGSGSTGVFTYKFNESTEEEIFFAVQMPHSWKIGSDISPHVHWTPTNTDTGAVVWGLEYTWASIGDTFPATTIITATDPADGSSEGHQLAEFSDVTAAAISGVSSMMLVRVFRNATSAADTYDTAAALLEFDIHYQIDAIGSTDEYHK